jgi:2-keto-4-pentenoate hydratase
MHGTVQLANQLIQAEIERKAVSPFTEQQPTITLQQAYAVQLAYVAQKQQAGHRVIGKKIGATSKAIQQMFQVEQPDYGHLFDYMVYPSGAEIALNTLIQPKIESELAFVLKEDLIGEHITPLDVLQAIDYIVPAFEIIDSRIKDWQIRFEDTVSDNGSSGLIVLGDQKISPFDVDLSAIGLNTYKNDELVEMGTGSNVLGNPLYAVVWLANALQQFDVQLLAGEIILTGAFTAALNVERDDHFKAKFGQIGEIDVKFV